MEGGEGEGGLKVGGGGGGCRDCGGRAREGVGVEYGWKENRRFPGGQEKGCAEIRQKEEETG